VGDGIYDRLIGATATAPAATASGAPRRAYSAFS
jgi:hypothetical protein